MKTAGHRFIQRRLALLIPIDIPGEVLTLKRARFDQLLANAAVEAGATFAKGCVNECQPRADGTVDIRVRDRTLHARVAVLATGAGGMFRYAILGASLIFMIAVTRRIIAMERVAALGDDDGPGGVRLGAGGDVAGRLAGAATVATNGELKDAAHSADKAHETQ